MKFWLLSAVLFTVISSRADWPALHGNAGHSGFADAAVRPPFRLAWARHFVEERLSTAMEPIVADEQVFIATQQGNLYALAALSGHPQ